MSSASHGHEAKNLEQVGLPPMSLDRPPVCLVEARALCRGPTGSPARRSARWSDRHCGSRSASNESLAKRKAECSAPRPLPSSYGDSEDPVLGRKNLVQVWRFIVTPRSPMRGRCVTAFFSDDNSRERSDQAGFLPASVSATKTAASGAAARTEYDKPSTPRR